MVNRPKPAIILPQGPNRRGACGARRWMRYLALVLGVVGLGACGLGTDPNCTFTNPFPNYRFGANAPAATGSVCEVIFATDGKEARYAFPPLLDCADHTAPLPCVVVSGPRPAVCELAGCTLRIEFPGAHGEELSGYFAREALPYTVTCDASTAQTGTLEPYRVCSQ